MSTHRCYACDENNPRRIVTPNGEDWTFEFKEKFSGPPGMAHGGTAIGSLTCPALQLATEEGMNNPTVTYVSGRLNLPVPFAQPMKGSASKEENNYRVKLHDDSNIFLDGFVEIADMKTEPGSFIQEPPDDVRDDLKVLSGLADANVSGSTLQTELYDLMEKAGLPPMDNTCFGCSETENALKLQHKRVEKGQTWTFWDMEPEFTDGGGEIATTIIVAAVDCANLYTQISDDPDFILELLKKGGFATTGTLGARFLRVLPLEMEGGYRIAGRYLRLEGRKFYSLSVLVNREGEVFAVGDSIGIIFSP